MEGFACSVCGKVLTRKYTRKKHEERCRQLHVQMTPIGINPPNIAAGPNANALPTTGQICQIGLHPSCPQAISPNNHNMNQAALINQQKMRLRSNRSGLDNLYKQPCTSSEQSHQQANWARGHQIQQHPPASSNTPTTPTTIAENDGADDDEIVILDIKPPVVGLQQEHHQNQWAVDVAARLACTSGKEVQITKDRRGKLVVTIAGSTERTTPTPTVSQHHPSTEPRLETGIRRNGMKTEEQN